MPSQKRATGGRASGDCMDTFKLEGRPHVELHNLLKLEGWCESGAAAKHAVAEGRVTVNGKVELRKRCKITDGKVVRFEGQKVRVEA